MSQISRQAMNVIGAKSSTLPLIQCCLDSTKSLFQHVYVAWLCVSETCIGLILNESTKGDVFLKSPLNVLSKICSARMSLPFRILKPG